MFRFWLRKFLRDPSTSLQKPQSRRQPTRRGTRLFLEILEDRAVPATFTVLNTNDSGPDSFRQAILDANTTAGADDITFNIPQTDANYDAGTNTFTITPTSPLPDVGPVAGAAATEAVVIDATTQPEFATNGTPVIVIAGTAAGAAGDGLTVISSGNTIRGLAINRFTGDGIQVEDGTGNALIENFIGTNAAGTSITGLGNGGAGVRVTGSATGTIIGTNGDGTDDALEGNVISGNALGVALETDNNVVAGNTIGADVTGAIDLGNSGNGVLVTGDDNRIGSDGDGDSDLLESNLISGNGGSGVRLEGDANVVATNTIGADTTGAVALPNGSDGVFISGDENRVGTDANTPNAVEGNLISGNVGAGVRIAGDGNVVAANAIGTDVAGLVALPNGGDGIFISGADNRIGTIADPVEGNLIAGNLGHGIEISGLSAADNLIDGNDVGLDATGLVALPNGTDGINVNGGATDTLIGVNAPNVFSGNAGDGIEVNGATTTGTSAQENLVGVTFDASAALLNGGLAIRLTAGATLLATSSTPGELRGNVSNAGSLSPGASPGVINVTGNYTQMAAGVLNVEIQGTNPATPDFDQLIVSGTATLAGTLNVTLLGGFTPTPGQTFTFLTAAAVSGTFATVNVPTTGHGTPLFAVEHTATGIVLHAAIIVNSDNDPGDGVADAAETTLREAIAFANGNTGLDFIHFDVGGGGTETIDVDSALPALTGLTVIDGTTQPGYVGTPLIVLDGSGAGMNVDGLRLTGGGSTITGLRIQDFTRDGVRITSSNNVIGGTTAGDGNVIRNNDGDGVGVLSGSGNVIRRNSISDNDDLGIDLAAGANNDQAAPVITDVDLLSNTQVVVTGTLNRIAGEDYVIEFFVTDEDDPEGEFFIGSLLLDDTDALPFVTATLTSPVNLTGNRSITATATRLSTGDTSEFSASEALFVVTNTDNTGAGSLRRAIMNANNNPGTDTITFAIPGTGTRTINVTSALPALSEAAIIDGTSQPGYVTTPLIVIDGSNAGMNADGLTLTGDGSTIMGLQIQDFDGSGIVIASANNSIGGANAGDGNVIRGNEQHGIEISGADAVGNVVAGNRIGTNAAGTADAGNGLDGIFIDAGTVVGAANVIGGDTLAEANVISGNQQHGIEITSLGAPVRIEGNFIGTNAAGTAALGNGDDGIRVNFNVAQVTIGGSNPATRNVISGNAGDGIDFISPSVSNVVQSNFIGTNATGTATTASLGNDGAGVRVGGVIGVLIDGNVISGNDAGIILEGTGSVVTGNKIGTDVTGTVALGNDGDGVKITAAINRVGTNGDGINDDVEGNVISGNGANAANAPNRHGVEISGATTTNVVVAGNLIGTNAFFDPTPGAPNSGDEILAGTRDLGNALDGVNVNTLAPAVVIGGDAAAERNVISGNNRHGIQVTSGAAGTVIDGNSVGLDAAGTGALPNAADGINVSAGATGTLIGLTAPNVLSGNGGDGIEVTGATTLATSAQNNLIGTTVPNGGEAINLTAGATLFATSAVAGNLQGDVNNDGSLSPGASPGPIVISNGGYVQTADGILNVEIQGGQGTFDQISVQNGNASLAGTLSVTLLGGFVPLPGQNFTFISATGGLTGTFSSVNLPTTATGVPLFTVVYTSNDVILRATIVVNSTNDPGDGTPDAAETTLREAIDLANSIVGVDTIVFDVPAAQAIGGVWTIMTDPAQPGLTITEQVVLDATTQPTYVNRPVIEVRGSALATTNGLTVNANDSTIRGLAIGGFTGHGIAIAGSGNVIVGNHVGTDATGTIAVPNALDGINVSGVGSTNNRIGDVLFGQDVLSAGINLGLPQGVAAASNGDVFVATASNAFSNLPGAVVRIDPVSGLQTLVSMDALLATASEIVVEPSGDLVVLTQGGLVRVDAGTGMAQLISTFSVGGQGPAPSVGSGLVREASGSFLIGDVGGDRILRISATGNRTVLSSGNNLNGPRGLALDANGNVLVTSSLNGMLLRINPANGNQTVVASGLAMPGAITVGSDGVVFVATGAANGPRQIVRIDPLTGTTSVIASGEQLANVADLALEASGSLVAANPAVNVAGPMNVLRLSLGASRNVISGNVGNGIQVQVAGMGNVVVGNFIGTDAAGTADLGNGGNGVLNLLTAVTTVGGDDPGEGNVISGNDQHGVEVRGATPTPDFVFVLGNKIGTDVTGTLDLGNTLDGVNSNAGAKVIVGGATSDERNVISGNDRDGVRFETALVSNEVRGNFIGTNATGTADLGNGGDGVNVIDTTGVTIDDNVISGNERHGVEITLSGSRLVSVTGNKIGTDVTGTLDLGNTLDGVLVSSAGIVGDLPNVIVGGDTADERNVISGNDLHGVEISGPGAPVLVQGNRIGTNAAGDADLGNAFDGVNLNAGATGNTIGGATAALGNLISGNNVNNVSLSGATTQGNFVSGNLIGTDLDGTTAIETTATNVGVFINGAGANTIGGTTPTPGTGLGNVISGNVTGVSIVGASGASVIRGNVIGLNGDADAVLGTRQTTGVSVAGTANGVTIGGDDLTDGTADGNVMARNVISGNANVGVFVGGSASSTAIQGNFIGTDGAGADDLGNALGVRIEDAAFIVRVGGGAPGAGNVISGNDVSGIQVEGNLRTSPAGVVIQGNRIGTDATGLLALGNGTGAGVGLAAVFVSGVNGVVIGTDNFGTEANEGNVISGNAGTGLRLSNSDNAIVAGNVIGANVNGSTALSALRNSQHGLVLDATSSNNTIGGTTLLQRNLISGNGFDGVLITDPGTTNNVVIGNVIGPDAAGGGRGNGRDGVSILENAANNTIGITLAERNLISLNDRDGVRIEGAGPGNVVAGNLIGTDAAGSADRGNAGDGVDVIGTLSVTIRSNVISGNDRHGVSLTAGANSAKVAGNLIGTNASGTAPLGNALDGVFISTTSNDVDEHNVISGNGRHGVELSGPATTNNDVAGNFIGLDATGTVALGNALDGINVNQGAGANRVGGTTGAERNVISANGRDGIHFTGPSNWVKGNFIGTDAAGAVVAALGNAGDGIHVHNASGIIVGGTEVGAGNRIAGNHENGVEVFGGLAADNTVMGNEVSANTLDGVSLVNALRTTIQANTLHGNGRNGVRIDGANNTTVGEGVASALSFEPGFIGPPTVSMGNSIIQSGGAGVAVLLGTGNTIRQNVIQFNGRLDPSKASIDLGDDGRTQNDPGDGDVGANGLQNFPNVTRISSFEVTPGQGFTTLRGTLVSTPGTTFIVDLYDGDVADATRSNARRFLGQIKVTTSAFGTAVLTRVFESSAFTEGLPITITATDQGGNTSEFSLALEVRNKPVVVAQPLSFYAVGAGLGSVGVVRIFNAADNQELTALTPFGVNFMGGLRIATGDVNGDGVPDVVVATGPGGNSHVKVIDGATVLTNPREIYSFLAFPGFQGGTFVAVGDVNGDSRGDVIVSGQAHVKVFDGSTPGGVPATLTSFFAFENFEGEIRVAAGDFNGDDRADVIVGAGPGSPPHVKVFDVLRSGDPAHPTPVYSSLIANFNPDAFLGGVYVAAGDVNGDGFADLIVGAGSSLNVPGSASIGPVVTVINAGNLTATSFLAYDPGFQGGVRVAVADADGDGFAEVVTVPELGAGADVRLFDVAVDTFAFNGLIGDPLLAMEVSQRSGAFVG